jgi:hypothetical protein
MNNLDDQLGNPPENNPILTRTTIYIQDRTLMQHQSQSQNPTQSQSQNLTQSQNQSINNLLNYNQMHDNNSNNQ